MNGVSKNIGVIQEQSVFLELSSCISTDELRCP